MEEELGDKSKFTSLVGEEKKDEQAQGSEWVGVGRSGARSSPEPLTGSRSKALGSDNGGCLT